MQRLLRLTPEQRQSLVQLRAVCLGTLGTIMEERNRIHAFLTVSPIAPLLLEHQFCTVQLQCRVAVVQCSVAPVQLSGNGGGIPLLSVSPCCTALHTAWHAHSSDVCHVTVLTEQHLHLTASRANLSPLCCCSDVSHTLDAQELA